MTTGRPIIIPTPVDTTGHPIVRSRITFVQDTPALVWTINHNLGHIPAVSIIDSEGNLLSVGSTFGITNTFARVNLSETTAVLTFNEPTAGKATLV